ncbi:hypothetical protein D3C84_460380 [compost metagenome]
MELHAHSVHALLGARVGGDDHRIAVMLSHGIEHRDQLEEVLVGVDVLFTVGADHKELACFQPQAL